MELVVKCSMTGSLKNINTYTRTCIVKLVRELSSVFSLSSLSLVNSGTAFFCISTFLRLEHRQKGNVKARLYSKLFMPFSFSRSITLFYGEEVSVPCFLFFF